MVPVGTLDDDVVGMVLDELLGAHARAKLAEVVFPADLLDTVEVHGIGGRRDQAAEIAVVHEIGDVGLVGDAVEQRTLALVQQAALEAVRRGGQADDLDVRVHLERAVEDLAIHALARVRDQMRLVDDNEVEPAIEMPLIVDRLDRGDGDLSHLAHAQTGRVDAERRHLPALGDLLGILLDQFLDVRENEDVGVRPCLACLAHELSEHD